MMRRPVFAQQELSLLPVAPEDAELLYRLVDGAREDLGRWLAWAPGYGREDAEAFVREAVAQQAQGRGMHCLVQLDGRAVGMIGQAPIDRERGCTSLGYWLIPQARGRGVMTRACRAMVSLGFARQGLHRVEIWCAAGNWASRRIPERLGFVREGLLRHRGRVGDRYLDMVVYAMLASEWRWGRGDTGP